MSTLSIYGDFKFFESYGMDGGDMGELGKKLREEHRFYHNEEHIFEIVEKINDMKGMDESESRILKLTAYFHDSIYNPISKTNEEDSVAFMKSVCKTTNEQALKEIEIASTIIIDTKTHVPSSSISIIFCDLDLYGLRHGNVERVLADEGKIFKEFQIADYSLYKAGRIKFLEDYRTKIGNDFNVDFLKGYLAFRRPKIGLYAGAFDPFHKGHMNILQKAEKMFDKVIVARGNNPEKKYKSTIADLKSTLPYRQVEEFEGFLTDYSREKSKDADITLIKGLRNGRDLEEGIVSLRFMEELDFNVSLVLIHCDQRFEHVSSSGIKIMESIKKGSASQYLLNPSK